MRNSRLGDSKQSTKIEKERKKKRASRVGKKNRKRGQVNTNPDTVLRLAAIQIASHPQISKQAQSAKIARNGRNRRYQQHARRDRNQAKARSQGEVFSRFPYPVVLSLQARHH